MKIILQGLFKYHVIPIVISVAVVFFLDWAIVKVEKNASFKTEMLSGTAVSDRGLIPNCSEKNGEIELIGSLQNPNKLSVFGSSELQETNYAAYIFLPDSLGLRTTAFGHAYHQNLSIACELLAAGEHLNGANVCIILSPGWFEGEGTNIEAFLEFVRPNFLKRIIHDKTIPKEEKLRIAHFVSDHYSDVNNPSKELTYLRNMSVQEKYGCLPQGFLMYAKNHIPNVEYKVVSNIKKKQPLNPFFNWVKAKKRIQGEILKSFGNNSIYVDSAYFTQYLLRDGKYVGDKMEEINPVNEFEDFKMVVDILKRHHCKATFIIQPLNPYHFADLHQFNATKVKIKSELAKAKFPVLDLYVTSKKEYTPGILKDVMHPSDFGWMEINEFLVKQYPNLHE
jgi:D-alanyl-lipoteichoic acid biosynthesis protein DltD